MTSIPTPHDFEARDYSIENAGDGVFAQLNSLLRGEISAAETYAMAIRRVADGDRARSSDVQTLRDIQEEHGRTCQLLRSRIRELGGTPANSSGAWGAWAKAVEGAASLFGDNAALKALKEGEEHGLKDYTEALDDVDASSAAFIESELIPAQRRHISQLEWMMNSASYA